MSETRSNGNDTPWSRRNGVKRDNGQRDAFLARLRVAVPAPKLTPTVSTASASATSPTAVAPGLLQPQWSSGVTIKKAFKGDARKKTCLVEVGGQEYVLKGAPRSTLQGDINDPGNRSTAEDNAAAALLIRNLGLNGVRAPAITVLKGAKKAEVVAALQTVVDGGGAGARDASELIESLRKGDAQLSEADPGGVDSAKIFFTEDVANARRAALQLRKQYSTDPDACWNAVIAEAVGLSGPPDRLSKHAATTDQAQRKQAVATMQQEEMRPRILEYVAVLEDIANDEQAAGLQKAEADAVELAGNQDKLKNFAKSPEGITAYAGVAVVDLLTGMDDRILGAWNGGNFLFDPDAGELACVDNNKKPSMGLSEADSPEWDAFFGKVARINGTSIADAIYDSIYNPEEGAADEDRPAFIPGLAMTADEAANAKDRIRLVLAEVVQAVENDASAAPAAIKRVGILKELMLMQDVASVPTNLAFQNAVEEPSITDKFVRGVKSIGRSWFGDADKIKIALRSDPSMFRTARADLQALILQHPKDSKGGADRLAEHIRFLATACEFGDLLAQRAAMLRSLGDPPPFPVAARRPLDDRTDFLNEEAGKWQASLKTSDGAIAARIAAGATDLTKAFLDRKAAYTTP